MRKAIIGGTGWGDLKSESESVKVRTEEVETKYGLVHLYVMTEERGEIVFLPRHGKDHSIPAHKVNYRANIAALKAMDVDEIYAACAVGSMNLRYPVGEVVIIDDFLDFTKSRPCTFFDGEDGHIAHALMAKPFCDRMTNQFLSAAFSYGITVRGRALYVCTEGPRYETAAEVRLYRGHGGDVAGMTLVPECILARELGMCYAAVGIVTNWCTGLGDGRTFKDIVHVAESNRRKITSAFADILLSNCGKDRDCQCEQSVIVM